MIIRFPSITHLLPWKTNWKMMRATILQLVGSIDNIGTIIMEHVEHCLYFHSGNSLLWMNGEQNVCRECLSNITLLGPSQITAIKSLLDIVI